MIQLTIVRMLRGAAWGAAAFWAVYECREMRYALMHQDTAFQQNVLTGSVACRLIATLIVALAIDRVLELRERGLSAKAAALARESAPGQD